MKKQLMAALAGVGFAFSTILVADTQGVNDTTIKIGNYTDLSGPLAVWGVPSANGMRMRFEEANEAGGVHGRKIEFLVEDMQYQVPRAIQSANKLLRRDKVFTMVGALGTPMNLAVMPKQFDAKVPNMYPLSGSRSMAEPLHPMKYSFFRSYYEQYRAAVKYFKEKQDFKTPCVAQIANEAGEEMAKGVVDQLAVYDLTVAARTEHGAADTDLTSSITTFKQASCDIVFLATAVRDTIISVATAKKLGFTPTFVTGMVPYMDAVAQAAEGAMEGLYLVSPFYYADVESAEGEARRILETYARQFDKPMEPQAQLGYIFADLTVKALLEAGDDLSVESFLAATSAIQGYVDPIGGQTVSFSEDDHQGVDTLILAQVQNKKWALVDRGLDY